MDHLIAALQKVVAERGVRYYTLEKDGTLIIGPTGKNQIATEADIVVLQAQLAALGQPGDEDAPED